ncbi:MAG: ABC transporter substrate-binding protein [bacterium]
MNKDPIIWVILKAILFFGFCGLSLWFSSKIVDRFNEKIEPFAYPQRIISLGPALTEQLYLLGVEDRLVGCTVYCKKPKEAESKEKVGTIIEVNLEKVVDLKPDLVLATSLTDPKAKEKLKDLGIKVACFPQAKNFSQMCDHFLGLGRLVGKDKEAKKITNSAKDKVAAIKEKVKNLPKPEVFIQIGAKPLFAATGRSFINDFIEFAGGINMAKEAKEGIYSREEVLKKDPEVIIIVTMGIVGEKEKEIWQSYQTLKAVKKGRIYIVDSYQFCSPTPVSFVEALEEMAGLLHPELYPHQTQ